MLQRVVLIVAVLLGGLLAVAEEQPRFTTEQKKEIVAFFKMQADLQKFIPEVCKAPKWQFNPSVPNAEGTGTEPGCVPAPPPPPAAEKK